VKFALAGKKFDHAVRAGIFNMCALFRERDSRGMMLSGRIRSGSI